MTELAEILNTSPVLVKLLALMFGSSLAAFIMAIISYQNSQHTQNEINRRFESEQNHINSRFVSEQSKLDDRVDKIETEASKRAELDRIYERNVFLREKYEEYGETMSLVTHSIQDFCSKTWQEAHDGKNSLLIKHLNKAKILTLIYFPELEKITTRLGYALFALEERYLASTNKKSNDSIVKQLDGNANFKEFIYFDEQKSEWIKQYKANRNKYTYID